MAAAAAIARGPDPADPASSSAAAVATVQVGNKVGGTLTYVRPVMHAIHRSTLADASLGGGDATND